MISSNLKNVRNTPPVLLCIIETGNTEFNSRFSKGVFSKVCLPLIFLHMTNTQAMSAQLWQFRLQC